VKLTVDFPALETLRGRMGAPLSGWRLGDTTLDPRAKLLIDLVGGIEIDLQDVEAGPGKLLTYRGEQVILYIKDTRSSQWTLENEPEKSRRFHIAECRTLDRMREEGRFERYVVTNRTDGLFLVDWLDPDTNNRGEMEAALKVCKNCLSSLNWRGYEKPADRLQFGGGKQQSRTQIWERFAIDEFLREYSTFFRSKPSRKDLSAKLNIYVEDWPHISEQRRWQAKWRCETCSVGLSAHPNLLHCHHKNGVVTDNDPSNLMVLCALCHAEQPGHNHMKVPASQRAIILAARGR
jgi:hypothetical protein